MTDSTPLHTEILPDMAARIARPGRTLGLGEFVEGIDDRTEEELMAEDKRFDPRNYLQGDSPIYLQDLGKPVPIHWTAREWVLWALLAAGAGIVAGLLAVK